MVTVTITLLRACVRIGARALGGPWPPQGFVTVIVLRSEVVSLTPNPQPGGPGYPI
jgi:hypothetical protein